MTAQAENKRIAKNTGLLYIRMLFTMGIALFTSRVILHSLGVEDYGLYSVIGGIVTMFTFLNGAMAGATQRFLTFEIEKGDKNQLSRIFSTSIQIHLILALGIIILGETIGLWLFYNKMIIPPNRLDAAFWVFQLSVIACAGSILQTPYNADIIAHERMGVFAYISILDVTLKLGIAYLLYIITLDRLKTYALLVLCVQFLDFLIYATYCTKNFQESRYKHYIDKSLLKRMTNFAAWTLFGNMASIAYTQGLNLLLNIFFGPVVNAARGIAVQVQSAINGFVVNFQTALNPQITKTYAAKDLERMHSLIFASSKYSFFLLFFLSLPIIIETQPILHTWLGVVPNYTVIFVRLMLAISLIDSISNPLINSANATGNIKKYQIVIGGILLLILPFSYFALKLGATPESVFIIHLLMVVCAQTARIWMIRPMIRLSIREYFKKVIVKIGAVSILSAIIPLCLYNYLPVNVYSIIFICALCLICVPCFVYIIGLNSTEKSFIQEHIKRKNNQYDSDK